MYVEAKTGCAVAMLRRTASAYFQFFSPKPHLALSQTSPATRSPVLPGLA
jgi:hypothetical protein